MNIHLNSATQFLDAQEKLENAARSIALALHDLNNNQPLSDLLITEICRHHSIDDFQLIIDTYNELLEISNPV